MTDQTPEPEKGPPQTKAEQGAALLDMCEGRSVIILDPSQMPRLLDALAMAVTSHMQDNCDPNNPRPCNAALFANTIGQLLETAHSMAESTGADLIVDLTQIT